jgi:hypothetical protein
MAARTGRRRGRFKCARDTFKRDRNETGLPGEVEWTSPLTIVLSACAGVRTDKSRSMPAEMKMLSYRVHNSRTRRRRSWNPVSERKVENRSSTLRNIS